MPTQQADGAASAKERALAARQATSGPASYAAAMDDPPVYLGGQHGGRKVTPSRVNPDGSIRQGGFSTRGEPDTGSAWGTVSSATARFYQWSDAQREEWGQYLVSAGMIESEEAGDYGTLLKAWSTAVAEASRFAAVGKQMTPRDVVKLMGAAGGAKGFSGTRTSTSRNIDLTDPTTAKALVNDVLSRQLGRAATPEEINQFTQVLNTAERANPSVTTTSTTFQSGEAVSQESMTSGGLTNASAQQMAIDQARATPGYADYQSATTYMDALLQGIGAVV